MKIKLLKALVGLFGFSRFALVFKVVFFATMTALLTMQFHNSVGIHSGFILFNFVIIQIGGIIVSTLTLCDCFEDFMEEFF